MHVPDGSKGDWGLPVMTPVRKTPILNCEIGNQRGSVSMRIKWNYFGLLLAAAVTIAPIASAPTAAAASQGAGGAGAAGSTGSSQSQQSCEGLGGNQSQCQSPGNAQIFDAPPQVDYFPYGGGGT